MKKYTAIIRDAKNNLNELAFFAEKSSEVKAVDGFVAITKTERVKHPSPEVMQRVLLGYQINQTPVDLATFYADCDKVAEAIASDEKKPANKVVATHYAECDKVAEAIASDEKKPANKVVATHYADCDKVAEAIASDENAQ